MHKYPQLDKKKRNKKTRGTSKKQHLLDQQYLPLVQRVRSNCREKMGGIFGKSATKEDIDMALDKAKHLVSSTPVLIFSKTYCGFCNRVKNLLKDLGASFQAIELDKETDGDAIQGALLEWTGQRTVPNVFIGGKHIGGCDAVIAKHQQGQLVPMLANAKAIVAEQTA